MTRQISGVLSAIALTLTVIVPLYCLIMTPGDSVSSYDVIYSGLVTELPALTKILGRIPKAVLVLGWFLFATAQMALCFFVQPRWWVGTSQILVAVLLSMMYAGWHIASVHLPMVKLFNDLS